MSTYRLEKLLSPKSIAVVGGSPREKSLGRALLKNLRGANFGGPIHVINNKYPELEGIAAAKSLRDLPIVPDLTVVVVPPAQVPSVVAEAAAIGSAAAVIITAGLGHGPGSLAESCEQIARPHGLRLLGPNCIGVMAPIAKLNATFAAHMPEGGDLAVISQSGAVTAGLI